MGNGVPMLGLDNWTACSSKMLAWMTLADCVDAVLPPPRNERGEEDVATAAAVRMREAQRTDSPKSMKAKALMTLRLTDVHHDSMSLPTAR